MKIKKTLALFLVLSISANVLVGCGKKEEKKPTLIKGDIEVSEEDMDKKTNDSLKKTGEQYDFRNLPVAEPVNPAAIIDSATRFTSEYESAENTETGEDEPISVDILYSWYARNLSQRSQLAYREILVGALNRKESVTITKPVSKDEFEKIMNIMFLDTPEAFMLEHEYEYTIDSTDKVSSVKLFYSISEPVQKHMYEQYVKILTNYSEEIRRSSNSAEAVERLLKSETMSITKAPDKDKVNELEREFDSAGIFSQNRSLQSNALFLAGKTNLRLTGQNYIAASKVYVAILRDAGIDAAVKVGTLLNPKHYLKDNDYYVAKPINMDNLINEKIVGNGVTHVTCNFNSLYSWVSVNINNKWFNVDPFFTDFFKMNLDDTLRDSIKEAGPMLLVDDYLMSQSRIFYINDVLLGRSEPSNGRTFQPLYRNGNYVPEQDAKKLTDLMDYAVERMTTSGTNYLFYQFGSRENFSDFVNRFDERVTLFNKQYKNPIRSYKLYQNEELLLIGVHSIVKKDVREK